MGRLKQFVWVMIVTVSMILTPVAANAFTLLQCDASGGAVAGTTLFNTDTGSTNSSCQYSSLPVIQHVFSYVICDFTLILNQIMGSMYCGINYYMKGVMTALFTAYLTIYGAQILMGTAQLSTRDAIIRLLKLSFVFVFAIQSAFGINFIFQGFLGIISTTSTAVLNVLSTQVAAKNDGVCSFAGLDPNNLMSMYSFLDYLVCHALFGSASQANTRVQGLLLAMIFALPPMTAMFQWWVITTVKTLVVTLVTFLKCLAAIAFLVTLCPFFLAFYLFQSTAYIFENWLRYLISFSVQICIVLAIVVLWVMTINQFVGFFNDLSKLIFPYEPIKAEGGVFQPSNGWAICPPTYYTDASGNPAAGCSGGNLVATPLDLDGDTKVVDCNPGASRPFDANPPVCTGTAPNVTCKPPVNPSWQCDNLALYAPAKIVKEGQFLYYMFFHLIALLLISYCFSMLLKEADKLARALAGPQSVPSLTPGWGSTLGNADSFKAPAFAGARPGDRKAAVESMASDLRRGSGSMVNRR